MSAIVFVLSKEASARVRSYCNASGADLNGLASGAVRMLMDIMDEDLDGPWDPEPNGMATGHDSGGASSVDTDPAESIEPESTEKVWEQAQDEADAVRTMLDERTDAEREIVAAVVRARAAGLSIRAIVAELAAAGMRPAGGGTK